MCDSFTFHNYKHILTNWWIFQLNVHQFFTRLEFSGLGRLFGNWRESYSTASFDEHRKFHGTIQLSSQTILPRPLLMIWQNITFYSFHCWLPWLCRELPTFPSSYLLVLRRKRRWDTSQTRSSFRQLSETSKLSQC